MRVAVVVVAVLSLGACGGQGAAPVTVAPEAVTAPAEAVELGVTVSSIDCPLEKATYSEPQAGWELRFRKGESWEMPGMTESVFELVKADGTVVWGEIASNMGTSRDVGRAYFGCTRPGRDDGDLTEAKYDACRLWEGVVYSLNGGEPGFMPYQEASAPERLLMSDVGRKLRYSDLVSGPGGEPWDVFTFKACAK
ncbi:MAG: hypothetical protein Q8R82_18120 [Hyphomonadaceae bacterium]|nr:hypothetical protein [Hyphomonadaceae bacterium]